MRQRKTKRGIERIAYSPSGGLLVGRDAQNDVQVWDARTLEPVEAIPAGDPREKLLDCLFRAGGRLFLEAQGYCSAGRDLPAGPPRPEHQAILPGFVDNEGVWGASATTHSRYTPLFACFGQDGQTFVGRHHPAVPASGDGLWRFDGELVRAFEWMSDWTVNDMAFSADGRFLAAPFFSGSAGYEVAVVDLQAEPPAQGIHYHTHNVLKVVWSPAAPLVACAATRSVWVWDAGDLTGPARPVHHFPGFRKTVEGLCFSPDGSLLVAGAREGRIRVWEVESGRERADLDWKSGRLNGLAFSPDGSTIAAAYSKGVIVWDSAD